MSDRSLDKYLLSSWTVEDLVTFLRQVPSDSKIRFSLENNSHELTVSSSWLDQTDKELEIVFNLR